ncbi:IS66 family transposase [Limosilactobacillus reuteri]|uniref:IS66 family transposase n=1 Tax=Limosilactobacillus reuteri TaxID=1598 RepID=UPI00273F818E|nr:transposase [Limosilactobacillus reuteri]WLR79637.1 transposase [Limosilactobacillus reuteri]
MAANVIKVSQTYLEPLYDYLQGLVKKELVIHMDETLFKVIDESNGNGYFGVTRSTKEFSKHQTTMFHYYSTRAGKTVGQILGQQYSGVIICNGYGYSDRLYPRAKFGSCCSYST